MRPHEWSLAIGMVITGSINTLSTAWADKQDSKGSNGDVHEFDHPFFQAAGMFIGELTCLAAFYVSVWRLRSRGELSEEEAPETQTWSPTIFILPAACDMTGTSLMYLGLTMTSASIFQMLRGSVVIFTGILSVVFLKRKLHKFHWTAMAMVLIGVAIVGLGTLVTEKTDDSHSTGQEMLGNGIIICAQMVTAIQMVVEEAFVSGRDIPALQAVGWEGCWGLCFISVALVIMYFIPDHSKATDRFEDSIDAFYQISNSWKVALATCGNVLSIAFFNFFGISVTKAMSAAHRMVIDSVRTFVIWGFSLAVGWEKFSPLQLVGFAILLAGTVFYQELYHFPGCPEFWGYTQLEVELDKEAGLVEGGLEDPDGLLETVATPAGKPGPKRSFTTVDQAKGSMTDVRASVESKKSRASHIGSMTGSFVGR